MSPWVHAFPSSKRPSFPVYKGDTESPIDPDVVKLSVRTPAGVVTTATHGVESTIVKEAVGKYFAHIDANEAGFWFYRWWSTGFGQTAKENEFKVRTAQAVT